MKYKYIFIALLPVALALSCASNKEKTKKGIIVDEHPVLVKPEFKRYFDSCYADGSIVIFDNNQQQWIFSDTADVKKETLPASTFKIINLLIALETNSIPDEHAIVKWTGSTDTVKYGYRPEIYHDMTVKEAFEVSAGWVFIELAKKIGRENYKTYLARCKYGNLNLSQTDADFWNFGAFAISPVNQVQFIKNLYEEKLPFSKRNIDIVKRVMITEQTNDYTIHAKTGWTRDSGINTGWWVGYLEKKDAVYFFATQLLQDRKQNRADFGSCRKKITTSIFKDLHVVN